MFRRRFRDHAVLRARCFRREENVRHLRAILTAWAAAGIFGPVYVGYIKDQYPDRAVIYCFLIGVLILGLGFTFSYLLNDDRVRLGKPTLEGTLRQFGIPVPGQK